MSLVKKFGWYYKGTDTRVSIGDTVLISKSYSKKLGIDRLATVVSVYGFIGVKTTSGDVYDFYPHSLSLLAKN